MTNEKSHFRFDVYFLPGATDDDCKAHYFAARDSRPDYEPLLREFRQKVTAGDFSHPPNRLPPMSYNYVDPEDYQSAILVCPELGWRDRGQRIFCVVFDHIRARTLAEGAVNKSKYGKTHEDGKEEGNKNVNKHQDEDRNEDRENENKDAGGDKNDDREEERHEGAEDEDVSKYTDWPALDFPFSWKSTLTEEDECGMLIGEYLEQWAEDIEEDLQAAHTEAAGMGWTNW
ncbi:hypothetical protein BJY04DRAFT_201583 [Aspergillus karnatakaensis]|uniref:uncharacterized protein n=1 Tax=Aspergillus karnatakaensis TaxID=1810916 RepID=UPI003CCDB672